MSKYIHNISGSTKYYQGLEIADGSFYKIPFHLQNEFADNADLIQDIENGLIKLSRNGVDDVDTVENNLHLLGVSPLRISLALDKNGTDQLVNTTDWTVVEAERLIWDLNADYDLTTHDFVVPADGIYNFDVQLKLDNFSNVADVELAIFKRGSPDDYWFILDKKSVGSETQLQLNGATQFDFYKDERYTLKIKLTKVLPLIGASFTIEGSDDYSAWGYSISEVL